MKNSNNPVEIRVWKWIAVLIFYVGLSTSQIHVFAAPARNAKIETPFPLELQPPLIDNFQDAIDSYGNPIKYSQPIQTPDGRKVITAQGVQFEIPNYASGITEIKKPVESLLPPLVDPSAVTLPRDGLNKAGIDFSTEQQEYTLPDWLSDFNDPDVGPGVPYTPSSEENTLKVLSWDLIPPKENHPELETSSFGTPQNNEFSFDSQKEQTFLNNQEVQMVTYKPTTTTKTTYTQTTTATTSTSTTITTTPSPVTTTTTEVINTSSDTLSEIFALPGGDSVTLPSWLQDLNDPELSIAVPFEVPEDNNEYNHTIPKNLLPPLEPFDDLKTLSFPGLPSSQVQTLITTSTSKAFYSTTPSIRTTTTKIPFSTFKPFQFKFITKQPTTSLINFPQKPILNSSKSESEGIFTTTSYPITLSTISARIPQFSVRTSTQPIGFKVNSVMIKQPSVKPTLQTLFGSKSNPFFNSRFNQNRYASFSDSTTNTLLSDAVTTTSWPEGVNPGPGVPFSLSHNEQKQNYNGILSSKGQDEEQTKNVVTVQKSISSELTPLKFIHNSIPSQFIIPTNQSLIFTSTPLPEPSRLFTPPMIVQQYKDDYNYTDGELLSQTVPINSYNFPETTEPASRPGSKVIVNKSDQGKVISNSIFETTQPSTKPVPEGSQQTSQIGNSLFGSSKPGPVIGNSAYIGSTFSSSPTQSTTVGTIFAGKYTGGFKGAPGVLGGQNRPGYAIQSDGSIRDPDHTVRPPGPLIYPSSNLQSGIPELPSQETPSTSFSLNREYKGSFGGPPGILVPYDNTPSV